MSELRYTLVSEGSSDRMLLSVLDWLLAEHAAQPFQGNWADLGRLRSPPTDLLERIKVAFELYRCDLLFVHRDADREPREARVQEAKRKIGTSAPAPWVPVVPVRTQEAWFLFDEVSLRKAASNPNGTATLSMPRLREVEGLSDAKGRLEDLLRQASGRRGRRLRSLRLGTMKHRLASLMEDFAPLRALPAFAALEEDVRRVVKERGWSGKR